MQLVGPVERLLDLPHQSHVGRRDLLFIRWHRRRTEDEVEHLHAGPLDTLGILGPQERLGQMGMTEVDAVELDEVPGQFRTADKPSAAPMQHPTERRQR